MGRTPTRWKEVPSSGALTCANGEASFLTLDKGADRLLVWCEDASPLLAWLSNDVQTDVPVAVPAVGVSPGNTVVGQGQRQFIQDEMQVFEIKDGHKFVHFHNSSGAVANLRFEYGFAAAPNE